MRVFASTLICLSLVSGWAAAQDDASIEVGLERSEMYEGESVRYQVKLVNFDDDVEPSLSGLEDFQVTSHGQSEQRSQYLTVINGTRTMRATVNRVFSYSLTPNNTGQFVIPAPTASHRGKLVRGEDRILTVKSPDQQDMAILEIDCDAKSVYPQQPFTVTLKIFIKPLPAPVGSRDPTLIGRPRELSIPWVNDDELPNGLEVDKDVNAWLGPRLRNARGGNFAINRLTVDAVQAFFNSQPTVFHLDTKRVQRVDDEGKAVRYWEYSLARRFTATTPATFTFGPVTLKGMFATRLTESGQFEGERIYAVAKAIDVVVKPVPTQGRPESFTGAIGRFNFTADLAPQKVSVGDPMTLTLTLAGKGLLEAGAPDLSGIPDIAERFRIYDATEVTKGDARTFTYSVRPKTAGSQTFPAVPIAYFDVEQDKYVTVATEAIPIEVTEADRLRDQDLVQTPRARTGSAAVEISKEGLFANITDVSAVHNDQVQPGKWFVVLAGLAALYGVIGLVTARFRRLYADPAFVRRRSAPSRARAALKRALQDVHRQDRSEAIDEIRSALAVFVADIADVPAQGLTPRDVSQYLERLGVDHERRQRLADLLEQCDASRYGSIDGGNLLATNAQDVLEELISDLKSRGLAR